MEKDFTADIAELQAHYTANRVANASIATEVRNKYRTIIEAEIRTRKAEVDKEFADHLARVKARSGMPLSVIQEHVLHTKAWSRWTYWRDLAEIAPERISVTNAREEAKKATLPFRIEPDEDNPFGWTGKLVVTQDAAGEPIEPFEVRDFAITPEDNMYLPFPMLDAYVDVATLWGDRHGFNLATKETIKAAHQSGMLAAKEPSA